MENKQNLKENMLQNNIKEMIDNVQKRIEGALDNLSNDFKGLSTGRASPNLLDPVYVEIESYGSKMRISELGTITIPEPRTIAIDIWDKTLVKQVEKAIVNANLGLNPMSEGTKIRINLPTMTEERRKDLVKLAKKYCENTKIAIRNIRRDILDNFKKMQKDSKISEDEHKKYETQVQEIVDKYVGKVDVETNKKEKEILTI